MANGKDDIRVAASWPHHPKRRKLKQLVGDLFVPALKVGNQRVRGFEAGAYDNLLDLAGYPKTAPYGSKPSGGLSQ